MTARVGIQMRVELERLERKFAQPGESRNAHISSWSELVIPKTLVPYRIRGTTIEIARVYHSSRRWPEGL